MTRPAFDSIREIPIRSDQEVLELVGGLVGSAIRRQLWLMLLDPGSRPLPLVLPCAIPRRPRRGDDARFARFVADLVDECDASAWIVGYERPGDSRLTAADRAWAITLGDAARTSGRRMRGPVMVHDRGARWMAVDDLLGAGTRSEP